MFMLTESGSMLGFLNHTILRTSLGASSTGWLGIDFGSTAIKTVQLRKRRNQLECLQDAWIETPPLDDNCVLPFRAVDDTLPPASIVTSNRWIEMEFEPKSSPIATAGLQENLQRQWSAGVAYLVPDADFQQAIQPKRLQVAPGLTHWLGHQLLQAGIEPRMIDSPPWSLSRALTLLHGPKGPVTSAMLDWSASTPMLVVQHKGLPQFTRVLENGGLLQITEAIRERLKLSFTETIHYLKRMEQPAVPAPASKRHNDWTASLIAPHLRQLSEEINRSLHFLKWQCPKLLPTTLYLCGGGASLPCLVEPLQSQLEIELRPWSLDTVDGHTLGPTSAQAAALSATEWLS